MELRNEIPIVLCSEIFEIENQVGIYIDDDPVTDQLFLKINENGFAKVCYIHSEIESSSMKRRKNAIARNAKNFSMDASYVVGSSDLDTMSNLLQNFDKDTFIIFNSDLWYMSACRMGFSGFSYDGTKLIENIMTENDIHIKRDIYGLGFEAGGLMLDLLSGDIDKKIIVLSE